MHENRETSSSTVGSRGSPAGEGDSRNTGMNGGEESDGVVVPVNPANKATVQQPGAAEWEEGRTPTKENIGPLHTVLTQWRTSVSQGMVGVRQMRF
jgi:RNA-directed DNA polymerase